MSASVFQSTRPAWGATAATLNTACTRASFQSTRPAWGATLYVAVDRNSAEMFQSTRPRGARLLNRIECAMHIVVSIHAPRVGRDCFRQTWPVRCTAFQSTRPAWGATGYPKADYSRVAVSIHAPAWGATSAALHRPEANFVSIHAPRVGRDDAHIECDECAGCFNPRARVGRDQRRAAGEQGTRQVSIHAPAWGATAA